MEFPLWKRLASYLWDVPVEVTSSEYNDHLAVSLVKNKLQLSTKNAIYSFDEAYDNFRQSFTVINWENFTCDKVLVLGFGLGSIPLILQNVFEQNPEITAVELDETIVDLAVRYTIPRLRLPVNWYLTDSCRTC